MNLLGHIGAFLALILGLALTRVLANFSILVKHTGTIRWYGVHILWALWLLAFMALEWWTITHWQYAKEISFFAFLFMGVKPALLYLAADLLFPAASEASTTDDLRLHFQAIRIPFFLTLTGLPLADLIDTLWKGWDYFRGLGIAYPLVIGLGMAATLSGAYIAHPRYQAALVLAAWGILLFAMAQFGFAA